MARLFTTGGEWQARLEPGYIGPVATEATIVHSPGGVSTKIPFSPAPGDGIKMGWQGAQLTTGRKYFARCYWRANAVPADQNSTPAPYIEVLTVGNGITSGGMAAVITTSNGGATPGGRLGLIVDVGGVKTQVGSYTALSLNTWYCIEVSWVENTVGGAVELRLDGAVIVSGTAQVSSIGGGSFAAVGGSFVEGAGFGVTGTTNAFYYDDFALNDDQGANQNSYPDAGFVYLLTPTSDQARTNWTGGAGGTTNLWDAVNNKPPVGVITGLTNTSQIINSTKSTTENYDGLCPAYSSVMGAGETIKLAFAIDNDAENPSTGTKTGCVYILSNPAQTEPTTGQQGFFNFGDDAGAPSGPFGSAGWPSHTGPIVYSGFTAGTAPVVRVGKRTSSSNAVYVDALGIIFETAPAVSNPPMRSHVYGQAVQRAATWMKRRSGIVVPRLWTPADGVA